MTKKVYRSAQGKTVDMGALLLQNEAVRAVGNMGVNARGDIVDSRNRVIDSKNKQVQRQNRRQTSVTRTQVPDNTVNTVAVDAHSAIEADTFDDLPEDNDIVNDDAVVTTETSGGGLASAIAKARSVTQEKLKTPRQLNRLSGVKKI
jgi:hypothetical protein